MDGKIASNLSDAITSAIAGDGVVKLRGNGKNEGISLPAGSNFTLDLNGHKLTMTGPGAGSEGTKTQGFQFLKGSNITIKNGILSAKDTPDIKMLIQNYSNLTLDNVKLIGTPTCKYLCSNNCGNVKFINGTTFEASEGQAAFDAWYGMFELYDEGVNVTLDSSVKVTGRVEIGKAGRASFTNFANNCSITIPQSFTLDITASSTITGGSLQWVNNSDGTKSYKYIPE